MCENSEALKMMKQKFPNMRKSKVSMKYFFCCHYLVRSSHRQRQNAKVKKKKQLIAIN